MPEAAIPPAIEHHVYFAVFGFDEHPQEISLLTGIEADDTWLRGSSFSPLFPDARRLENRWILSSNLDHYASHRDHFEKLLLKLERLGETLALIRERYRCGIGVSQYYFMDDPAFYLPDELVRRYQQLGFPVSFDQLCLDA